MSKRPASMTGAARVSANSTRSNKAVGLRPTSPPTIRGNCAPTRRAGEHNVVREAMEDLAQDRSALVSRPHLRWSRVRKSLERLGGSTHTIFFQVGLSHCSAAFASLPALALADRLALT